MTDLDTGIQLRSDPVVPAAQRLAALFPEPSEVAPRHWWQHRGRLAIAVVAVLTLVATTVFATSAFGSSGASYRTVTVANHGVDSVLTGVATIEPVTQAAVAFPTSGTVATVDVAVGQTVSAGQPLASLDTQSLMTTLHQQQAALAQSELKLSKALSGQAVGSPSSGTGGAGPGSTSGTPATSGTSGTSGGSATSGGIKTASSVASPVGSASGIVLTAATTGGGNAALAGAQQAVLAAQHQVDQAISVADTAMAAATPVCAAAGVGTTTSTTSTTSTTTTLPSAPDLSACQTAIQAVQTAQQQVGTAQTQLAQASKALDALLQQPAAAAGTGSPNGSTGASGATGSRSATGGSATTGTGAKTASTAASPSSADLVAYQQAVDAAGVNVAVATQSLAQATITSPIAGTVVAVNLTPAQSVSGGSSTANILVTGPGGYEVSTSVSVDLVVHVKVGQAATLVPDGSLRSLTGKVVAISGQPDATTTGSTPTYRVVIGLDDPNAKLNNGATGTVSIVTDRATSALAVPTSAVTTAGSRHAVTVLQGGSARPVSVQVGVVGDRYTEITGGLTAGQSVVLATVNQPLPSSATSSANGTTTRSPFGGAGGFRISAFGGGGGGGGGGAGGR